MTGDATIFILVYVDDSIITGSHLSAITAFFAGLHRTFSLKDLGRLSYFLGIEVLYSADSIHLCQAKYLHDLLQSKPISSPVGPIQPSTPDDDTMANPTPYRQISPRLSHWREVKRMLRYLKGTLNLGLTLAPSKSMDIVAYSNAGWVSDVADLRSQHGFVVFLGNNLVSLSRKQKVSPVQY
ncbi:hypothetical protein V2J09_018120 [Rumex salicifolius]